MNKDKKHFKNTHKGLLEAEMYLFTKQISTSNMSPVTLLYTANKYLDGEVD